MRGTGKSRPGEVDRHVGARIKRQRVLSGLSQGQLAERVGVTWQQVWKYETGTTACAPTRLLQIARALGVEIADLLPRVEQVGAEGAAPSVPARTEAEGFRQLGRVRDPRVKAELVRLIRALADAEGSA